MYFVRTEETEEQAIASLERGRSVRRWAFFGCTAWEHLAFAIPEDEQIAALEAMGYDLSERDVNDIIHNELFHDNSPETERAIAEACNLTKVSERGYAEFLDGLCALEAFDVLPSPDWVSASLDGKLFAKLVCYEGEPVGVDPDEGWPLFKPTRIVWIHDTGSTVKRGKHI